METCFYYDGQTALAQQCGLYISDECVYITITDNPNQSIIWNKTSITQFELSGNHLLIKYGEFPQQTVEYTGDKANLLYEQFHYKNTLKKSKVIWLKNLPLFVSILIVAFVSLCLVFYFWILPFIGDKTVALIPKDAEIELGNQIAESILQTSTEDDSATVYANQFFSKTNFNSQYPIRIYVVESEEINAYALPGGSIFVNSEIIKHMNSYEEFAALLSHEMSHVEFQHSLQSICRTTASSMAIAFLFGDISGISAGILQQADAFKQLDYSRELETQADDKGFELMVQHRISPSGMVNLLSMLKKQSTDMPGFMKYFSTHPNTDERILNISSKPNSKIEFIQNQELHQLFIQIKSSVDK